MTVPTTMRAAVLTAPQRIEVETRDVPEPAAGEVLVRIASVGVCGSDVHFWHDGRLGEWVVDEPLVLGHESSGTIVAVGAGVDPSRVGERVSIEPQHPEPWSRETLAGTYNLDPGMRFYATPGVDGAFQEYATIGSAFAWRVPDEVGDDAAALLEPLSVAIAAVDKAGPDAGGRVLVSGAGPVGIAIVQVLRARGASEILVSDIDERRRRRATDFGATTPLDPSEVAAVEADAFLDASGAGPAVVAGIRAVRPAGSVVLVGMGRPELELPVAVIQNRELRLTGVFRYANTWPRAIDLARRGAVDLDAMVTGHYRLEDVEAALASTSAPATLKSVVHPGR